MTGVDYDDASGPPRLEASRWPLILFLLVVVAAAAAAVWFFVLRPIPRARYVLVAARGCNAECVEDVRVRMGNRLREHGFERPGYETFVEDGEKDPVEIPEETAEAGLDALSELALDVDAGHVVLVEVSPVASRSGLTKGKTFVTARVTAHARTIDEGDGSKHDVVFATEGVGRQDALRSIGVAGVDTVSQPAIAAIAASDRVAEYIEETSGDVADSYDRVLEAHKAVPIRQKALARYHETCDEAAAQVREGEPAVRCVSGGCAEEYAMGVSPDGSQVLLKVETGQPVARLATRSAVSRAESPERLDWAPLGEGERVTLAHAKNFYSWGALSDGGTTASMIEKADRRYGLVVVDIESGERRVLMSVKQPQRLQDPIPSPDGSLFAVTYRKTRRAPPQPAIAKSDGSGTRTKIGQGRPVGWVHAPRREGAEPTLMLVVETPRSLGFAGGLALVDPETGDLVQRSVGGGDRRIDELAGVADGVLWMSYRDDEGCGIARYEVASGEMTAQPTSICVTRPRIRNGRMVASAVTSGPGDPSAGDEEIVEVDVDSGEVTVLTKNAVRDRYPQVAADGAIVFERFAKKNYERFPRVAVCTLAE